MFNFNDLINKKILVLQYPKGDLSFSEGKIKEINKENNYEFTYLASTESGSSGSPIFLKDSIKIISIHKSGKPDNSENYGDFIGPIFQYFKNFSKNKEALNLVINDDIYIDNQQNNLSNNKLNEITIIYNVNILRDKIKDRNENKNESFVESVFDENKNESSESESEFDDNKIRIFGKDFVRINKNNCYLMINNQKMDLCEYLEINKYQNDNNSLEIKLFEINPIINMSHMFNECESLISLPDISKWDTKNVKNMSNMFTFCKSLISLPDISEWDTKNVTDISSLFCKCKSLISFPDISEWDTKNVTNISDLFSGCHSLLSLPDISKWNTKNITDMSNMFTFCESLISLPDISKWDTKNVTNMSHMLNFVNL